MGQARQKGSFETRKAQAIAAGRIKRRFSRVELRQEIRAAMVRHLFGNLLSVKRFE